MGYSIPVQRRLWLDLLFLRPRENVFVRRRDSCHGVGNQSRHDAVTAVTGLSDARSSSVTAVTAARTQRLLYRVRP